jgi:hypothetical protein
MNIYQWLSEYIWYIATIYQLALVTVFVLFAIRIGDVRTLDDLLPEEGEHERD